MKGPHGHPLSRATWEAERRQKVNDLDTIAVDLATMAAKLDNDGGVTDTDYEATLVIPDSIESTV